MSRLIDWAQHATPDEIEQRYGRAKHRLDQAIIDWLWHHGNSDASMILGLLRVTLTSDKSQILRDFEKHGPRRAEQRIKRMLLNAERSDTTDANKVLSAGRDLQLIAAEHLNIHERAVLSECVKRAVESRGEFTFGVRNAQIAATCTRHQADKALAVLQRAGFIVLRREHVKARRWARRWSLGDAAQIKEGGHFSDTASPVGGRAGSGWKVTRAIVTVDPDIASAIYSQIGTDAHDMHMHLCALIEGATVSAFARAASVTRLTARRWLIRLSEFNLAEKRGQLWHAMQPDLVKWRELYDHVNGEAAKQRIAGQVREQRDAFDEVAARIDERDLCDAEVDALMKSGSFRDRRAAYRTARAARLARGIPKPARHEHFEQPTNDVTAESLPQG